MAKRALVTGVTGQDGSYLAEFLLSKGYEVHGLARRSSSVERSAWRIQHLLERITLHEGDMCDGGSLIRVLVEVNPDEVYNLAAMSFVPESFKTPDYTGDVVGLGTARLLEGIRHTRSSARFYQASSSEMFGSAPAPQDEETRFHPRSPYGIAKLSGHWYCVNAREAYKTFACSGLLFNHECVTAETPIIVRYPDGRLDCAPIRDVVPDPAHVRQREVDFEVWDDGRFVRARLATATWNGVRNDKRVHRVIARCGEVRATADHVFIRADGTESNCEKLEAGERLKSAPLPEPPCRTRVSADQARLLGLLSSDGCVSLSEGKFVASFRNTDEKLLRDVAALWERTTGGRVSASPGVSGFTGETIPGLTLRGESGFIQYLHEILYTSAGEKRVPHIVLNADSAAWIEFLRGYNEGDGLKAGNGTHEFKNFKSSSPTLAAGLWWMASRVLDQKLTYNVDFVKRQSGGGERLYAYHSINLGVPGGSPKGQHLLKDPQEIKRVVSEDYVGWLYDLETESGTFHAGIGDIVIHNSPRRGELFVTRKIARGVARIKAGVQTELLLGNLDAQRDWGFAGDYVEAMWLMLQYDAPDDYVIATGETHSVREFVSLAFARVGLDWERYVRIDPRFYRPAEVHVLRGDASKARRVLGWSPKTTFKQLVEMMVDAEVDAQRVAA